MSDVEAFCVQSCCTPPIAQCKQWWFVRGTLCVWWQPVRQSWRVITCETERVESSQRRTVAERLLFRHHSLSQYVLGFGHNLTMYPSTRSCSSRVLGAGTTTTMAVVVATERAELGNQPWQVVQASETVFDGRQLLREDLLRPTNPVGGGAHEGTYYMYM